MKNESNSFDKWMNQENSSELKTKMEEDWERIQTSINRQANLLKINKRRTLQRGWYSGAAAMLILIITSTLIWLNQNDYQTVRAWADTDKVFILPDGSSVELTKGSKIRFPKTFAPDNRLVKLKGVAYFDVVSSAKVPFIVHTGDAKIRVTGTTFKVSAVNSHQEVAVQVDSGKVLFYNSETLSDNSFRVGLGPGEIGTYLPKLKQLNKTQFLSTP